MDVKRRGFKRKRYQEKRQRCGKRNIWFTSPAFILAGNITQNAFLDCGCSQQHVQYKTCLRGATDISGMARSVCFLMMLLIMFDHVCARAWIRVILVCRERLSSKQKNENGHFAYMKPPFWGFIQSPQLIRLHNFAAVFCSQQRFKFCQEPFSTVA